MENDLISRSALLKMMSHWKPYMDMGLVRQAVEKVPAVDAVPVVRCKDCDHMAFLANETATEMMCALTMIRVSENHFCSDGERKENENN